MFKRDTPGLLVPMPTLLVPVAKATVPALCVHGLKAEILTELEAGPEIRFPPDIVKVGATVTTLVPEASAPVAGVYVRAGTETLKLKPVVGVTTAKPCPTTLAAGIEMVLPPLIVKLFPVMPSVGVVVRTRLGYV